MLRAFVEVEFYLDASVRPSLIELLPGQRTDPSTAVQKYEYVD